MGLTFSNYFCAIAPVCGGGLSWRCSNLKNTPVWALRGDADDTVSPKSSMEMVEAVNKNGGNAKLTLFHDVGHDSRDNAYTKTTVLDWILSKKGEDFSQNQGSI